MQDNPIPPGFCQCGCGEPTSRYKTTHKERGQVKGEYARYLTGHHLRRYDRYELEDRGYLTPCWVWKLATNAKGYGRMRVPYEDRKVLAHRWYYEAERGPIPEGLELDHLCCVPACVNPDHLEPVTRGENQRRGWITRKRTGLNQRGELDLRLSAEGRAFAAERMRRAKSLRREKIREAFRTGAKVRPLRAVRKDVG